MSGYDWSGNPTLIYRYNISADKIDLVIDTALLDQMVNNLAVDSNLYTSAPDMARNFGRQMPFWGKCINREPMRLQYRIR